MDNSATCLEVLSISELAIYRQFTSLRAIPFVTRSCDRLAWRAMREMAASETATSKPAAMPYADASKLRKGNGDLLAK